MAKENKDGNGNTPSPQQQVLAGWEKYGLTDEMIDSLIKHLTTIRAKGTIADANVLLRDFNEIVSGFKAKLLDDYFRVAEEVRGKRRMNKPQRRESLKRLIAPLLKYAQLQPVDNPFMRPDGTFPFVSESIYIKDEIPIRQVHYDQDQYIIDIGRDVLDPDEECITIIRERDEYMEERKKRSQDSTFRSLGDSPGRHSLRELYEGWIGTVDQATMRSRDLLDQLLIVFAMKRALNGEERTIERLFELYSDTATAVANKIAHHYHLQYNSTEIESVAQVSLRSILIGFSPRTILNNLADPDSFLPLWMEKFCIYYFSRYVPDELNKSLKMSDESAAGIQIMTLLYPSSFFNDTVKWRGTPKRIMRLNNMSFRPRKSANLTTWLFGTKNGPSARMNGRFCQVVRETLKRDTREKNEMISIGDYEGHDHGSTEREQDIMDRIRQDGPIDDGVMAGTQDLSQQLELRDMIEALIAQGLISRRDADIYLNPDGYNKTELAKAHDVSRRHIYRICENVEKIIRKFDK